MRDARWPVVGAAAAAAAVVVWWRLLASGEADGQEPMEEESREQHVISALKTLQANLSLLTPVEQSEIKKELSFASPEWLDGLAIATRVRDDGSGCSISSSSELSNSHGSIHYGGSAHGGSMLSSMMVTASPMPKRRARVKGEVPEIMRVESIDEMSERLVETATAARIRLTPDSGSLVIVLVGLPARGKSMLGHKLARFLTWRGYKTKHFCAGDKRRHAWNRDGDRKQLASASMFDSQKAYASMTRETISMDTFEELVTWLRADSGQVAIFDACNSTMARRKKLTERIHLLNASVKAGSGGQGAGIVFIESVVTDPEVVHTMSLWKVRNSADFAGMTEEAALADLNERIGHYERGYQTVHETEGPYIKLFDLRAKVHACNVYGRMAKSVLPYLLALHSIARPIFMLVIDDDYSYVLPGGGGESKAQLTAGLARWVKSYPRRDELCILTSAAPRAKETAEALADAAGCARPSPRGPLTPLLHAAEAIARSSSERRNSAGATAPDGQPSRAGGAPLAVTEGRPAEETFESRFGETIADLVGRLDPVVTEVEAAVAPVLLVAHEAHCRALRTLLVEASIPLLHDREKVDPTSTVVASGHDAPRLLEFLPTSTGYSETVHVLSRHGAGPDKKKPVGLGSL